jgi:hypothetical protein
MEWRNIIKDPPPNGTIIIVRFPGAGCGSYDYGIGYYDGRSVTPSGLDFSSNHYEKYIKGNVYDFVNNFIRFYNDVSDWKPLICITED